MFKNKARRIPYSPDRDRTVAGMSKVLMKQAYTKNQDNWNKLICLAVRKDLTKVIIFVPNSQKKKKGRSFQGNIMK